jgi:segregation and condensation protein A
MEQEFESILDAYPVRLQNFEGPLDLLLHLIKKNEVSIYDIPITLITQQYIEYIDLMQELNLDVAGEFLVMAATLIHIKSRMLLPRPDPAQEDPEEDPREALMRRLLEHQKFKAAAELLHERETLRSAQWTRPDGPIAEIAGESPEPEIEVDLFSLISAFRAVVERAKARPKVVLPAEQIPIEDRIEQLMERLSETEACGFEDLFEDVESRAGLVVTFLALLEMGPSGSTSAPGPPTRRGRCTIPSRCTPSTSRSTTRSEPVSPTFRSGALKRTPRVIRTRPT